MSLPSSFLGYVAPYLHTCERHLLMAEKLAGEQLPEGVMFHVYHALESICAAGLAKQGIDPKKQNHPAKFTGFTNHPAYASAPFMTQFTTTVSTLVSTIGATATKEWRDWTLYYDGGIEPKDRFTDDAAFDALADVDALYKQVKPHL